MISIECIDIDQIPWKKMDQFGDRTVFQTLSWINFIAATQSAERVVAAVKEDGCTVGYFTGLVIRKFGLKILGSPFRGWNTDYIGFNLPAGYSHTETLKAVLSFAFSDLGCHYLEIVDPRFCQQDYGNLDFEVKEFQRFVVDLTKSEDELFTNMKSSCRRNIRKAIREGVVIEESYDIEFADDYYAQLEDVYAKQALVPPYNIECVSELIRCLYPSGNLLLLRAKNSSGNCIATGIFPAFNESAMYWGGASWRNYQNLRPNELLMWYALKYWKKRRIKNLDLGMGWPGYKKKFGIYEVPVSRLMKANSSFLTSLHRLLTSFQNSHYRNWALRRL